MNIILLGAPGSGKGTQADMLVEKFKFEHVSTGDLFRENISKKTELGNEAQKYISDGKLVPDSVTNGMVEQYLQKKHEGILFDGYPRTVDQANALAEMLQKLDSGIDYVLYLDVDKDVLLERLTGRWICPKCKRSYHVTFNPPKKEGVCDHDGTKLIQREDDKPEKIKVRLKAFAKQTEPLINLYKEQEKIVHVSAANISPKEVFDQIVDLMDLENNNGDFD